MKKLWNLKLSLFAVHALLATNVYAQAPHQYASCDYTVRTKELTWSMGGLFLRPYFTDPKLSLAEMCKLCVEKLAAIPIEFRTGYFFDHIPLGPPEEEGILLLTGNELSGYNITVSVRDGRNGVAGGSCGKKLPADYRGDVKSNVSYRPAYRLNPPALQNVTGDKSPIWSTLE